MQTALSCHGLIIESVAKMVRAYSFRFSRCLWDFKAVLTIFDEFNVSSNGCNRGLSFSLPIITVTSSKTILLIKSNLHKYTKTKKKFNYFFTIKLFPFFIAVFFDVVLEISNNIGLI